MNILRHLKAESVFFTKKDFKEAALKKPGQPFEIAPIYVFPASQEATYIGDITIPAAGVKIAY